MNFVVEFFSSVSSRFTNTRWGQILDFPSFMGIVEVVSAGNAQEEGVAAVTRLNRLLMQESSLPVIAQIKKHIDQKAIHSLILFFKKEHTCQFQLIGKGKIILRRGKIIAPLLGREGSISGEVRPGDCIFFLSETAVTLFGSEEAELFSTRLTAKEIAEELRIRLEQEGPTSEGAVIGVVYIREQMLEQPQKTNIHVLSTRQTRGQVIRQFIASHAKNPRSLRYLGVAALGIFFLISVLLGIQHQKNDKSFIELHQSLDEAQKLFDEGVSIADLQPIKSRETLQKAQNILFPYSGKNIPKGKDGKTVETLQKQIQESLNVVSKVYTPDIQLFYDASFLQKDRSISLFTVGDDNLAFVDNSVGMVGVVSLAGKDAAVVAGGSEYTNIKYMTFQDQKLLLFNNDSVKSIEPGKQSVKTILTLSDVYDTFAAFGGNIYGLKRTDSIITRYPAKEEGFGEKENYLLEDVHDDLTHTTNLSIDGSVWLGSTIGKIYRYTQGNDDSLLIRGVDPVLGQNLQVFVDIDNPNVYLFDPDQKRIVIISKEGVYQSQYVWNDTIHPTAFGVSLSKKKIFLLSDKKIYSFSL